MFVRSSGSDGEKEERLQQLKDEQQQQLLTLRQEQYYSQKYLQREHIKMVSQYLHHKLYTCRLNEFENRISQPLKKQNILLYTAWYNFFFHSNKNLKPRGTKYECSDIRVCGYGCPCITCWGYVTCFLLFPWHCLGFDVECVNGCVGTVCLQKEFSSLECGCTFFTTKVVIKFLITAAFTELGGIFALLTWYSSVSSVS